MVVALTTDVNHFTAGQVGITVLTGMLIVFAVLAIIYFAMSIMQVCFTSKKAAACTVTAPFDAYVEYLVAINGSISQNDVVMVVSDAAGNKNEILAPAAGKLKISVRKGASVKKDGTLFTIG